MRLRAPPKHTNNVKVWADEAIWGHRFYNDQTPWCVFLELLAVFRSRLEFGCALDEHRENDIHEVFEYSIPRLIPLRRLIFNNPQIRYIKDTHQSDAERWREWLYSMEEGGDFSYLQDRFQSFEHLSRVIEFFQTTAIEPNRQRRWTSRFLFPYGPDCLYADLPANVDGSPDRRFFARGGELLYLMLSRSGRGPELARKMSDALLRQNSTWNEVVRVLLPEHNSFRSNQASTEIGYLPFVDRPEYSDLARTWLSMLDLKLPAEALLDPLMRLSVLHMLIYMLRRSYEEIGDKTEPRFVLEVASPRRTTLFEISSENLAANRMLPSRAVRAYVKSVENEEEWVDALQTRVPVLAATRLLQNRYHWKPASGGAYGDPETLLRELSSYAESRHQQHVAKVHLEWSKQIGLTVSRRGTGTWYSPNDALLKALVLCIVEEGREEYHRFLGKLYERFNLVVGPSEAEVAFGSLPTDQNVFVQNTQRLEHRLRTLGLLRRLSDDCAYVENPFWNPQ